MKAALSLTAAAALATLLTACGGTSDTSGTAQPAAPTSSVASASADEAAAMAAEHKDKFCASATALGSLSKASGDAMAMDPAGAAKDFAALGQKVKALRPDAATPELMADIDVVVARLVLDEMVESHQADGTEVADAMAKLDDAKAGAEAAASRLVGAVKETCGVDIA
ncbi:MAG: hypothetical protein HY830_25085 [Actinobacteria bacterium]|nr:hypothetical protein [Actinomycetota bacterium]